MALVINGIYVFDVYVKYEVIERKQNQNNPLEALCVHFFFYVKLLQE